jgi:hypothetical protein
MKIPLNISTQDLLKAAIAIQIGLEMIDIEALRGGLNCHDFAENRQLRGDRDLSFRVLFHYNLGINTLSIAYIEN